MSIKNIKFISTIGDKTDILNKLEEKIKSSKILENRPEMEQSLESLKETLSYDNYKHSDVMKNYIDVKNGKYIIFCKGYEQMKEIACNANEIFGEVNKEIKINSLNKYLDENGRKKVIRNFIENTDNSKLNLLLLNGNSNKKYDIPESDGVIIFYSTNDLITRRNKRLDRAIEFCKDKGTIIHLIDTLQVVEKYRGIKNQISEKLNTKIEFIEDKSFKDTDLARRKTFDTGISNKVKLELMKEYKEKTNGEISSNTVYKGYNIGNWQNNLRQAYMNGSLKMEDELLEQFISEGILGERKRAKSLSDKEKFEILKEYREKNPEKVIISNTVDENNLPIGQYRWSLQVNVNAKKSDLSPEQLDYLRKKCLINYAKKEINEFALKYNIPTQIVFSITSKYENIEEFVKLYKQGKANIKSLKLNKRGLIVSKNELTQDKKQTYLKLMEAILGKNMLEDMSKFIFEEDIIKGFNKLSKKEQNIIFKKFGINQRKYKEKEIQAETGASRAYIYQIQDRALHKLAKTIPVYSIDSLNRLKNKFTDELEKISKMTEEQWQDYHMNTDIKYLNFSDILTKNLKKNGYNTLKDLAEADKKELSKVPAVGAKKINMISEKIQASKKLKREEKINKIENVLSIIDEKISGYYNAYEYYMQNEDIFNKDEILPSSLVKKSSLEKKKEEKAKKQYKLNQLNTEIKEQDEKSEKIQNVLKSEDININNKIIEE